MLFLRRTTECSTSSSRALYSSGVRQVLKQVEKQGWHIPLSRRTVVDGAEVVGTVLEKTVFKDEREKKSAGTVLYIA